MSLLRPISHGRRSPYWSLQYRRADWPNFRRFPLHVRDKRVAQQKAERLIQELEREEAGIIAPKLMRDATHTAIIEHKNAFLADLAKKGSSKNTLSKYRNAIDRMCRDCQWQCLADITAQSFTAYRIASRLRPKTLNDLLGVMGSFLNWMERQQMILANPLKHVQRIQDRSPREYRRALSPQNAQKLLRAAPKLRALVYLTMLLTGLRSAEMKGLRWADFDLEAKQPCVRVPSSISKNRKASIHGLHPSLASALRRCRPKDAKPDGWVFRGLVPRVPTFKKDLAAAGIPFLDEHGRRMDLHALRKTFGTMLAANGVPLRVCMELMRHSESRLTEKVYTDSSHLPLQPAVNALPRLRIAV